MTYPIVIPLSSCGGKLKNNTELRFALRSIARHFKDDYRIIIVGKTIPDWLVDAEHIQSDNGLKDALLDSANAYPDGFFWYYDDFVMLHDATGEEMKVTPALKGWMKPNTPWTHSLEKIRERLEAEGIPAFDYSRQHGPYWFDKSMVDEGFVDWPEMKAKFPWESWILSKRDWPRRFNVVKPYYGEFKSEPNAPFMNYNDVGNTPELRGWLEKRFPEASKFEKTKKIQVHTIRFGNRWWLNLCAPTLDAWCERHGHCLRVWREEDINPEYPDPKFCQIDMLRDFVASNNDWLIYVDSDVYVDPSAPAHPNLSSGYWIREDMPDWGPREFARWCRRNGKTAKNWVYRNAGVWLCDKPSAIALLETISPPYLSGCMEQHQWNWWLSKAAEKGLHVGFLGAAWNAWAFESEKGAFYHLAGKNKLTRLAAFRANGRIPYDAAITAPLNTQQRLDGVEIVISRYREDVNWQHTTKASSVVYDKSNAGNLPNVGFEAQTFLHHFAVRYDSLAEVTVCLQGDPFPHLPGELNDILRGIAVGNFSFLPIAKHSRRQKRDGSPDHPGLGVANERMWRELKGCCPPDLWYAWYGGQFAVHKDRVRAKPQSFWQHAAEIVKTKEEVCAVERMWPFLFI